MSYKSIVKNYVDSYLKPNEIKYLSNEKEYNLAKQNLECVAKELGIWGVFHPIGLGGKIDTLEEYMPIAIEEGKSLCTGGLLGSYAALDAHMLDRFASDEIKAKYLEGVVKGDIKPSYAMTEPYSPGSMPKTVNLTAVDQGNKFIISGEKWWITNSYKADFVTVLVKHSDRPDTHSLIVIPTDAEGYRIIKRHSNLGLLLGGECRLKFDKVEVDKSHVLCEVGAGLHVAQTRLTKGRLLRSFHWLGLSMRCYELMHDKVNSRKYRDYGLADKQLVRKHIFAAYKEIQTTYAFLNKTAKQVDNYPDCRDLSININISKLQAANCLSKVVDSAIQLHGASGLDDDCILSYIYRYARSARILDGSDEALASSIGKALINKETAAIYGV